MLDRMFTNDQRTALLSMFGDPYLNIGFLPTEILKDIKRSHNSYNVYTCSLYDFLNNNFFHYIEVLDESIKYIARQHSCTLEYNEGTSVGDMILNVFVALWDGEGYPGVQVPCFDIKVFLQSPDYDPHSITKDFGEGVLDLADYQHFFQGTKPPRNILDILFDFKDRTLGNFLTQDSVYHAIDDYLYAPEKASLHTADRQLPLDYLKTNFVYPFAHMIRIKEA